MTVVVRTWLERFRSGKEGNTHRGVFPESQRNFGWLFGPLRFHERQGTAAARAGVIPTGCGES